MTAKVTFIFLLLIAAVPSFAQQSLRVQLESLALRHNGKVGLYAQNLKTGQTVSVNANALVPTASTIKLAVFVEAFHQIKEGKRRLAEKVKVNKEDIVEGSGILQYLTIPRELPLEDLIVLMMIESDNSATNLVIDQVGIANVNARITSLGLKDTYLYKKVFRPAPAGTPADQPRFGLGKTTAREMGQVMASIERCELGEPRLCKRMIEIMKNQQYRNMIPHYIEAEVDASEQPTQIADKTGSLDASRSDVGIVYTKNGPIVISAYTYENKDHRWTMENEGELLIARMAKAIHQAWAK